MKVSMFHLMPYRDLPADFEKNYESAWFNLPFKEVADAQTASKYYNWTLDELQYGAEMGFDGVCTNEHHQNAYGFMVNPNMMGSVMARLTRGTQTAIIQMGETAVFLNPPIRVAEEYAMLDCISEGRMVAGFPVGLGGDFAHSYGFAPMEQRERYREAHALITKAWQADDVFAWNGKYYQLPMVSTWPRPLQQPHPPIWVPGNASPSTWDFVLEHDYCYCYLTYFGAQGASTTINGYWNRAEEMGRDNNPYRLGYLMPIGVAETDEEADRIYGPHIEYFYHKLLHLPEALFMPPGHMTHSSLKYLIVQKALPPFGTLKTNSYKEFKDQEYLLTGSVETVKEQLLDVVKRLRVGNLMVLPQFGSMGHDQAMRNIELFTQGVLPALRDVWDEEGWVNHWWPQGARQAKQKAA